MNNIEKAMAAWEELAYINSRTDSMVNDLLEEIAGSKYDDDSVYATMENLSEEERGSFLEGCKKIKNQIL